MYTCTKRLRAAALLCALTLMWSACGDTDATAPAPAPIRLDKDEQDMSSSSTTDAPVDMEPPDTMRATGSACTENTQCLGGTCISREDFVGGYCTSVNCDPGACADVGGGECLTWEGVVFCADECTDEDPCREGYTCAPVGARAYCLPEAGPPTPTGRADGAPCLGAQDCASGSCIEDSDGWPDGYCTTLGCSSFMDCQRGEDGSLNNRCLIQGGGRNLCVRICQAQRECRTGYVCQPIGGGQGFCAPDPREPLTEDLDAYPFDFNCAAPESSRVEIAYTIADDTTSYMFAPVAADGRRVAPRGIDLPSGGRIDLRGPNSFQLAPSQIYGYTNPTIVPATPNFTSQLEAGAHTYDLDTDSGDLCSYLLEESTPGGTIDINLYFVGVPGIDASSAPTNASIQAVLGKFDEIYQAANVQIGTVRYFDADEDTTMRYSVIRSQQDIQRLVATSARPGDTLDDVVSINAFFTQRIALGGAIGVSSGLPGPAGLHGTPGSGVVFTSQFLGRSFQQGDGRTVDGNDYTGIVFAHEVGHYIGLFHTTEQGQRSFDPLDDTTQCPLGTSFPNACPDLNNLMFPLAGIDHTEVTPNQSFVIQVNPLTKD
ncbi:MAG: M12 family metallo-peptidase [Myxococcota bacterium]